jgi:2-C-methyl-D-erythritol 4-phosphate cytidylyltransferase
MSVVDAILLGAGLGKRFSEDPATEVLPKQFQKIGELPVLIHSIKALFELENLRQVVVVAPQPFLKLTEELIQTYLPTETHRIKIIPGGSRRQDSSRLAFEAIEKEGTTPTRILIHDACRPFLSPDFLNRIETSVNDRSYGAWIPVVPVIETLKRIENATVVETVDRSQVHRVQTPQVFEYSMIKTLMEKAQTAEVEFTDDASLCEYYGIPVGVFEGDVRNVKLTYEFELQALKPLLH